MNKVKLNKVTLHPKWNKVYRVQDKQGGEPHSAILVVKHHMEQNGNGDPTQLFVRILPNDRYVAMRLLEGQRNFDILGIEDNEEEANTLCMGYEYMLNSTYTKSQT